MELKGKKPKTKKKETKDEGKTDYDALAMKYLGIFVVPMVLGYGGYNLMFNCHKSWYSYTLATSASCVYAFGILP